jgi:DNA-binding beta-propeller fold protein YncE
MGYWIRTDTNYYIIDALHDRILIYDLNLNYQAYFGGTGSGNGQFNGPSYLAWDGTYLYVVDRENDRVQKFNGAGTYQGQFSVPGDPYGIGTNGVYLYITDLETNTVKVYSMGGSYLYSFGAGELLAPAGIWFESNYIYVVDNGKDRVPTFLPSSNELIGYAGYGVHDFLQPTDVRVNGPFLEVIDQAGTRLVSIRLIQHRDAVCTRSGIDDTERHSLSITMLKILVETVHITSTAKQLVFCRNRSYTPGFAIFTNRPGSS